MTEPTVNVPLSLLYEVDSITSLVAHRERRGLTEKSISELKRVSAKVRTLTDEYEDAQP